MRRRIGVRMNQELMKNILLFAVLEVVGINETIVVMFISEYRDRPILCTSWKVAAIIAVHINCGTLQWKIYAPFAEKCFRMARRGVTERSYLRSRNPQIIRSSSKHSPLPSPVQFQVQEDPPD